VVLYAACSIDNNKIIELTKIACSRPRYQLKFITTKYYQSKKCRTMANRCIEHIKKKKMRKIKKFTKKKEKNIYMIADIHPQQGKKL